MIKRIILEGNELNFKTTVANKLHERLGYEIVKGSSFEIATGTNEAMYNHFQNIVNTDNVIIDRFIYSNMVYATEYPKYTILTKEQFEELDNRLFQEDGETLILYLYTDKDTLTERLKQRGDEYIKEDGLEAINNGYEVVWEFSSVEPYALDTSILTSDDIVDFVVDLTENHKSIK